jgi:hypothetical protein
VQAGIQDYNRQGAKIAKEDAKVNQNRISLAPLRLGALGVEFVCMWLWMPAGAGMTDTGLGGNDA